MLLPVAYQHALDALILLALRQISSTVFSATVSDDFVSGGEWYFTFCSTNSKTMPKWIAVGFNGEIVFDNGLR